MNHSRCPKCGGRKLQPDHYVCRPCWFALPAETRRVLSLRDKEALPRLFKFLQVLRDKPLFEIFPQHVEP